MNASSPVSPLGGTTIVIADDHPRIRSQLRRILEGGGFEVVGEAADAVQAVAIVLRRRPAVCLLDVRMPGGGVRAAAEITVVVPETVVVMLTVSTEEEDVIGALRAGAAGYLLKDTDPERLPIALKDVLAGAAAIPRTLLPRVFSELRSTEAHRRMHRSDGAPVELTRREWEVLELLRHGLGTAEIAARLYVSPATVRTHVASLLHKLRLPDRAALLCVARGGPSSTELARH